MYTHMHTRYKAIIRFFLCHDPPYVLCQVFHGAGRVQICKPAKLGIFLFPSPQCWEYTRGPQHPVDAGNQTWILMLAEQVLSDWATSLDI